MEIFNIDEPIDLTALSSTPPTRKDLNFFASIRTDTSATIDLLIDPPFQLGRSSTIYMFLSQGDVPIGSAYVRYRVDEFVLSNIDLGVHTRQGIGTGLVDILLTKFPTYKVRGECPNLDSLKWHENLEQKFGQRMIPFTQEEIEYTHKLYRSQD